MTGNNKKPTSSGNDVITNFLAKKSSSRRPSSALGKLAVSQSNYFLVGNIDFKKAEFDKSLSKNRLDAGYKKIVKLISSNLTTKDRVAETLLHSRLSLGFSRIINGFIIKSSVTKTALAASTLMSFLYIFYTLAATNLYPSPLIILSLIALCLFFSYIRELLSKLR